MKDEVFSLELVNVSFAFDASISTLKNMNLQIRNGERIAVVGRSGIGKSSLLRIIAGLEKVSGGRIMIHGQTVSSADRHLPPHVRSVGMVFQDWAVFPHLSVFDNIAFGLTHRGKTAAERLRVEELLQEFELNGLEKRFPSTLSGGQLQRVACARAVAHKPEILLLDEPFSSLDVSLRQRIRQQVSAALKSERTTCILVTHDPDEASEFADRVYELRDGSLFQLSVL